MKKLLYSVSTALLLLSCSTEDPSLEAEPGKGGNVITFVGRTSPETRTEIGGKEGNSYPVLWSPGRPDRHHLSGRNPFPERQRDAERQRRRQEQRHLRPRNRNRRGEQHGPDRLLSIQFLHDLRRRRSPVVRPHGAAAGAPGDSSHTGKYTLAYDKTVIDPAAAAPGKSPSVSFSLRHAVAYVRLVISSTEYAGYKLNGASLWCDGEAISGDISVDVATAKPGPRPRATTLPSSWRSRRPSPRRRNSGS